MSKISISTISGYLWQFKYIITLQLRWDKRCIHGPTAFFSLCSPAFPSIVLCPTLSLCEWVCSTVLQAWLYLTDTHLVMCLSTLHPCTPAIHRTHLPCIKLPSLSRFARFVLDFLQAKTWASNFLKRILSGPVLQPRMIQLHPMPPVFFISPPSPAPLSYPCGLVHLRISSPTLIPSHINVKTLKHTLVLASSSLLLLLSFWSIHGAIFFMSLCGRQSDINSNMRGWHYRGTIDLMVALPENHILTAFTHSQFTRVHPGFF